MAKQIIKQVPVYLTGVTHKAFKRLAKRQKSSMTKLLEAAAEQMIEEDKNV